MSRKKPGPKGLLKNPRPVEQRVSDDGRDVSLGITDEVGPLELDDAEGALRAYFRKRSRELVAQPGEDSSAAVRRITRLATEALSESGIWWSGYAREEAVDIPDRRKVSRPWGRGGRQRRHVGPAPPPNPEDKCLWLDTSKAVIKRYDRPSQSWRDFGEVDDSIAADTVKAKMLLADLTRPTSWRLKTSWPGVLISPLRDFIARMLRRKMGRAGKSGRPAYLASATLGVLLDTTPETIADFLTNYRRR